MNNRLQYSSWQYFCLLGGMLASLSGCASISLGGAVTGNLFPDYAKRNSWAVRTDEPGKDFDVFYVYPTVYQDYQPANMNIYQQELREKALQVIAVQSGIFTPNANLYAPFYRQIGLKRLNPEEDMFQNPYYIIGYKDISAAFLYYLEKLNNGRPFILAGHSQGAQIVLNLLQDYFGKPQLQHQLVAAYVIGYSVTEKDYTSYPWLHRAEGADDVGVIISYNTQAAGASCSPVLLPGAQGINPLNWRIDETPALPDENKGAVFFSNSVPMQQEVFPNFTGARLNTETGALIVSPKEPLSTTPFPPGIYHRYDYALFYKNLEENVLIRCKSWKAKYSMNYSFETDEKIPK